MMTHDPRDPHLPSPHLMAAMELISALCEDRITAEQFSQLDGLVCEEPAVRALYVELMHLQAGLYQYASAMCEMDVEPLRLGAEPADDAPGLSLHETMVLPAVTTGYDDGGALEPRALPGPTHDLRPPPQPRRSIRMYVRGGIAAAATLVLGLLAHYLPLVGTPPVDAFARPIEKPPWVVATVELTSHPVWDRAGTTSGDGIFVAGESLILKSGVVQVGLRHHGRLVVEGPANVRFLSDAELLVAHGRIVATFPGGGLIVRCPTGTVRDLGTEFGVAVAADGQTEVAVFKGRVSAAIASTSGTSSAGAPSTTRPATALLLTGGQAATLSESAVTPSPQGAIPQRFVTRIRQDSVTTLDVADLVSGGDGTTHRRGVGVDSLTGAIGRLSPVARRNGDHAYHPSTAFPVVDGAFIPDGTHGTSVVDSAGDRFQFPPTTNASVNLIWTGGRIPWMDDNTGQVSDTQISTVLGGVDFATSGHGIVCTHCNNAVTLDLDAVRRLYPGRSIVRFHCKIGNSFINGWPGSTRINPVARAFVLIDGVSRYRNNSFTNQSGAISIDFQIRDADRFMTLAATDDGTDIDRDWVLWTDPKIDVAPMGR
jgi:hypothetical protein